MAKTEGEQAEINIGVIGHVDHGKTSLVYALSGKWTDTHSEELKRGISIRIGYADAAFYKCGKCMGGEAFSPKESCPNCKGKGKKLRRVSFVDAPGHETLMTTMLSGAALMHGAILVIAANEECPQPRTVEHLMALKISDVKNIVVVQNKIDLVEREKAIKHREQIEKFLKDYGYENVPVIPTAAHFGTNIDLLIEAIESAIPTPKFDEKKKLKMFAARSFDVNKPGTKPEQLQGGVLGGTIMGGAAKTGDEIEISPGAEGKKLYTKIVGLHTSEGEISKATPGGLIGIKTLLDPGLTKNDQMRGQVVGAKGSLPKPATKLVLEVEPFKRAAEDEKTGEIKSNELLVLTVGTATAVGTATSARKKEIELALKNPVVVDKGQRVALSRKEGARWRLAAHGTCTHCS